MPFAKNIGPDVDAFASYSFYRVMTAIDGREDIFDEKARSCGISRRPLPQLCEETRSLAHNSTLGSGLLHCYGLGLTKTTRFGESSF